VPSEDDGRWCIVDKEDALDGDTDYWQLAVTMCRHHFETDVRAEFAADPEGEIVDSCIRTFWTSGRAFMVSVDRALSGEVNPQWKTATVWIHPSARKNA